MGIPRCAKFGWTLNPECDGNPPLLHNPDGKLYYHINLSQSEKRDHTLTETKNRLPLNLHLNLKIKKANYKIGLNLDTYICLILLTFLF